MCLLEEFMWVEKLEYGVVGLNDGLPSAVQAPFAEVKESGSGREGGKEGIFDYLEVKYISLGSTFTDEEECETTLDRFMPCVLEPRLRELVGKRNCERELSRPCPS